MYFRPKKISHQSFIISEGNDKEIFFKTKIKYDTFFSNEKKKSKKIFNWLAVKLLLFFGLNSTIFFFFFFQQKSQNFSKKYLMTLKKKKNIFSKFDKLNAIFIWHKIFYRLKKKKKLKLEKINLCLKKLFLWEIFNKVNKISPENLFIIQAYGLDNIFEFQTIEVPKRFFFLKNILKKYGKYDYFFLDTIKTINNWFYINIIEHFSHILVYILFQTLIIPMIKIFWKPTKNEIFDKNKKKLLRNINKNKRGSFPKKNCDILVSLKLENKLSISLSQKHGWGIFVKYFLKKMTFISEYRGKYIQNYKTDLLESYYRYVNKNLFFFKLNSFITIDATFSGNIGRYINHSCSPNCFTKNINHGVEDFIILISSKNIKLFEELSYDYRINPDEFDIQQTICVCENVTCRKNLNLEKNI